MRGLAVCTFATLAACAEATAPHEEELESGTVVIGESRLKEVWWEGAGTLPDLRVYLQAAGTPTSTPTRGPVVAQATLPTVQRPPTSPTEGGWIDGIATHYGYGYETGESCGTPGIPCNLGCGSGSYSSGNTNILAVPRSRYAEWPCGTVFRVCGHAGCITATRHDACPGCGHNHVDLSEAGILAVCGVIATCEVTIEVLEVP